MAEPGPQQAKSRGSKRGDPFLNLERRGDREGNAHATHLDKSHPRGENHASYANDRKNVQLEIDRLKRELCHAKRKRASLGSSSSFDDEKDSDYKQRSQTPPSESFSYEKESHCQRRSRSPLHQGVGSDAMSKALDQISKSPFSRNIEEAKLPRRFNQPTFTIYNGRTDPMEHVSHFNQRMAVHSKDETLMCKIFLSSLRPIAMRWFDNLKTDSIRSFHDLTQAFYSRFVTCHRVPWSLASLLFLSMQEGETLKAYLDRHWETFNEMDGNFDGVAISSFKLGLPTNHGLRKSLTGKPVTSIRQLMDRINKYIRVEEDQQQEKGTEGEEENIEFHL